MDFDTEIQRINDLYEAAIAKAGTLYANSVKTLCYERDVQIELLNVIAARVKEFEV